MQQQPKIRVVVRKRPLTRKELYKNEQDIVQIRDASSVIVRQMKQKVDLTKYIDQHHFNFDSAFDQTCDNQTIYKECVRPIVKSAFQGARVTCFAYGQTGSGKTYTMNGDIQSRTPGMYTLGAQDIFQMKDLSNFKHLTVSMSFYQIYCGRLHDLLNNREILQARQDAKQNVNIVGLTEKKIANVQNFMQIIQQGSAVRITSQNSTNADSSRSHAILQISLLDGKKIFGKISFIDLAGCQRGADTLNQNKQTQIDGSEINKSLLALKECIRALDNNKAHTPFRGSKLTMVLKDSFTGFCKTLMIGNISPNFSSCENTLNTLRYADRVKQLKKQSLNNEYVSKEDQLARQLMLPRMLKNKQRLNINDEDEDLEERLFAPKRIESNKMQEQKGRTNRGRKKQGGIQYNRENIENMNIGERKQRYENRNALQSLRNNNNIINENNKRKNMKDDNKMDNKIIKNNGMNNLESSDYNNWQQILEDFRMWQNDDEVVMDQMYNKLQILNDYLRRQNNQILQQHQKQIQLSHQLNIQSTQLFNKYYSSNHHSLNYTQQYQNIIDQQITFLFHLKNKLANHKYHLKQNTYSANKIYTHHNNHIQSDQQISLLDQSQLYHQLPTPIQQNYTSQMVNQIYQQTQINQGIQSLFGNRKMYA